MKPPLTYYGGKQKLLPIILPLIPKHTLYCEPFFGGGAVFFAKEPARVEVINDTNGELMHFYAVLKTQFPELQERIQSTLHSRKQHEQAAVIYHLPDLFSSIDRAWAIWVLASQSFASKLSGSWGYDRIESKTTTQVIHRKHTFSELFQQRLEATQIESADAIAVIRSRDSHFAFFYCDPPYINAEQGHYKGYLEHDFERLLSCLSNIKGKFLLSSYPSSLLSGYTKRQGWYTRKIPQTQSIGGTPGRKRKMKTEVLTANYPI